MEVNYIGEHLWPGRIGHFLAILSMISALVAAISYFIQEQYCLKDSLVEEDRSWLRLARGAFAIHGMSVLGIVVVLFSMIFNQYWEYQYVYQHSSSELPVYYMISCFWEGQEGSFLLWSFWHAVLGLFVIGFAKKWESPVMAVIMITQVFLGAMLIGIYFFGYKIGSSPFILMRDYNPAMPVFARANYLAFIQDGSGLNPLLQNYWMVIHPPVLFLGFAATILPFAYSIAGLWKGEFGRDWTMPTLKWSIFSTAMLGIGIMMGGAWAYESLSFGGYWAWDPVENASLVPWIISICGLHTLLAYKSSKHSLKTTVVFFLLTFLLILYSTFLTRSGILGDTSVHAFTDLGMSGQLLVFLLSFVALSFIMFFVRIGSMPEPKKEESSYSREFWLFLGSLVMLLMALIVILHTSWPVINKITGGERVLVDPVSFYNARLIWFSCLVLILATLGQFLRYNSSNRKAWMKLIPVAVASLILTGFFCWNFEFPFIIEINVFGATLPFISPFIILMFASLFAVFGNLAYITAVLRGNLRISGGAVAHIGFALMMLGVLISSGKKDVISINKMDLDYGDDFSAEAKRENIYLPKGQAVQMGDYWVTYESDEKSGVDTYYKIKYERKEKRNDTAKESFSLYPYSQVNPQMGLISNPDTKHYWSHDVFTHVSSIPNRDAEAATEVLSEFEIGIGDSAVTDRNIYIVESLIRDPQMINFIPQEGDIAVAAKIRVVNLTGSFNAEPIYYVRGSQENSVPAEVADIGVKITFDKILPAEGKLKLSVVEEDRLEDFVILKAMVFPYISVLWIGTLLLAIGFFMSLFQRRREGNRMPKQKDVQAA